MLTNLELRSPVALSYNAVGNSQWNAAMNHVTGSCVAFVVTKCSKSRMALLNDVGYFSKLGPLATASAVSQLSEYGNSR